MRKRRWEVPFDIGALLQLMQQAPTSSNNTPTRSFDNITDPSSGSVSPTPGTLGGPGGTASGPATPYIQGRPSPSLGTAPLGSIQTDPSYSGQGGTTPNSGGTTLPNGDFSVDQSVSNIAGVNHPTNFWHQLASGYGGATGGQVHPGLSALGHILGAAGQGATGAPPSQAGGQNQMASILQQLLKGKQGVGNGAGQGATPPQSFGGTGTI